MKKLLLLLVIVLCFSANVFSQVGSTCWREVSAGTNFSLAIKSDGTLWGWGANGNLLGLNGITPNQNLPVQIGTANDWATVSAGAVHSLAVKTNGTLWSWGLNANGQLGLNNVINQALPVQVGTASNWVRIDAGNQYIQLNSYSSRNFKQLVLGFCWF